MSSDQTSKLGPPNIQLHTLKIWVHGRQYPDATDYWDGNWVLVTVECASQGAQVSVGGPIIHLSELADWVVAAEKLQEKLDGEANLICMEPELSVKLIVDKLGHMLMTVDITPDNYSEEHCFRFELDQSYLPEMIRGCRAVLDSYPIKSSLNKT
jgi:hypothetical protein